MRRFRCVAAFALVELLVTLFIFIAVFLALLDTWPVSADATQQAKSVVIATHLAEVQMERSVYQGYDNVARLNNILYSNASVIHGVAQDATEYFYTVDYAPDPLNQDLQTVTVVVEWQDKTEGVTRHVQLETLLTQPY